MSPELIGSDNLVRRAALLLADHARRLAGSGAIAEDVPGLPVPAGLAAVLRRAVPVPDRVAGWSVARGLLAPLLTTQPPPTPRHWRDAVLPATAALDVALVLLGSTLGRVFGWTGQQDSRLVHNILPSPGQERAQVGASSTAPLAWHTEDAFHPERAELLILACVRNDDAVGSRVASVRRSELSRSELDLLSRPAATITPDDSYPADWAGGGARPPAAPTVLAAPDGPVLRYDPSYTWFPDPDPGVLSAYRRLGERLDQCGETVQLHPGDVLLIDNDVAVHGRAAFRARYDGTDRWLKRVLVRLPRPPRDEPAAAAYGQRTVPGESG